MNILRLIFCWIVEFEDEMSLQSPQTRRTVLIIPKRNHAMTEDSDRCITSTTVCNFYTKSET